MIRGDQGCIQIAHKVVGRRVDKSEVKRASVNRNQYNITLSYKRKKNSGWSFLKLHHISGGSSNWRRSKVWWLREGVQENPTEEIVLKVLSDLKRFVLVNNVQHLRFLAGQQSEMAGNQRQATSSAFVIVATNEFNCSNLSGALSFRFWTSKRRNFRLWSCTN